MKRVIVLNVDDDEVTLMLHKILIKASGNNYEVENHSSGESALRYLKEFKNIDECVFVILLDINMPTMSGWDLLDELKHLKNLTACVALVTSSIDTRDREKAKEYSSVIDFFVKPINKNQLSIFFDKVNTINQ